MTPSIHPDFGVIALAVGAMLVVLWLALGVKVRAFSGRRLGVRVYDLAADFELPATVKSRSYRFALYLTMKSLPREPG